VAADAGLEGLQARRSQVLSGVGSPFAMGEEGPLQMGPEQAAAAAAVLQACLLQHRQGLAQRGDRAGHEGRTDRFNPVAPEQLQQLQQGREIAGLQFGEGQSQATVDLPVDPGGTQPVPLPVLPGGGAARGHGLDAGDPLLGQADAPEPWLSRQANVAQPAHSMRERNHVILAAKAETCRCLTLRWWLW